MFLLLCISAGELIERRRSTASMFYARIRLSASDAAVDSVAGAVVVSVCSGKLSLLPLAGKEIGNSYPTICAHFVSELCEACPSDINF